MEFDSLEIPFRTHQEIRNLTQNLLQKIEDEDRMADSLNDFPKLLDSVLAVRNLTSETLLRAHGKNWQVELQVPEVASTSGTIAKLWAASNNFAHAITIWAGKRYAESGNFMTSSHIALILACRDMIQAEP